MYKLPKNNIWDGRVDNEEDTESFRFHQVVTLKDINKLKLNESAFGIIGFSCDEGVRRNKGRMGAAEAPNEIKKSLAKLPYNVGEVRISDVGNVVCENDKLEEHQQEMGSHITKLLQHSHVPIILGGGHETLYAHYLGVREFIGDDKSLGIINIDAHFDLRDDSISSSGTMFNQIMENDKNAGYLCLGVQPFSNTRRLFHAAEAYECTYVLEEDLAADNYKEVIQTIRSFSKEYDHIMLTLDMDVIRASDAPGVSAPSAFGLDPKEVRLLLRHVVSQKNIVSFDVSEVNPSLDEDDKTTRLAALFVAEALANFRKENRTSGEAEGWS